MPNIMSYTGVIASIWIVLGIYIASLFYPNYSHSKQFCSELGAKGSPTEKLSPIINNYPLAIFFMVYGFYLMTLNFSGYSMLVIGGMIFIHGVGTLLCGIFPMDADPHITSPSMSCKIHSWSGMIMLFSLLTAPLIVVLSNNFSVGLRLFSGLSIVICLAFTKKLGAAYKAKSIPGLYQRLSYGVQVLWLLIFNVYVLHVGVR